MKKTAPLVAAALLALLPFASACGGDDKPTTVDLAMTDDLSAVHDGGIDASEPPSDANDTDASVAPIVAAPDDWTWVDVAGATCSDGSQTGLGVNPGTETDKVMFFFEGGGACGDYGSCYTTPTATPGPFGQTEFTTRATTFAGSYLDRTLAGNPFATWTYIYIPYCTGDIHGGTNVATYTNGTTTQMYHHVGHTNALLDIDRVVATWPTLTTLVVSGASAGGYGALFNYGDTRSRWASAKSYLIDDSGPPLEETNSSPVLSAWLAEWHTADWIKTPCPECVNDFSLILGNTSTRFPNDRLALLSSLQDMVISGFYLESGTQFQASLLKMEADRLDGLANFFYFFVSGNSHTMIENPASATYTSNTEQLETFIGNMVTDSSAWASTKPAP